MTNIEQRSARPAPHSSFAIRHSLPICALIVSVALLSGCATPPTAADFSLPYKPNNVYRAAPKLPPDLKRVLVLPLVGDEKQNDLSAGCDSLQTVLPAELVKTKRFEVDEASPAQLQRLTGRPGWNGDEPLPADFFTVLETNFDCDAVLFCQLTRYHPYPPLDVGWRLKLVDVRAKKILWSADENFNAGRPAVIAAARHYERWQQAGADNDTGDWLELNSPARFGEYSLASTFATLPAR